MRGLAFAAALLVLGFVAAAPAAAAPIDPGRLLARDTATMTPASIDTATVTASYASGRQALVIPTAPSAVGDRPADGTCAVQIGKRATRGLDRPLNLTIATGVG